MNHLPHPPDYDRHSSFKQAVIILLMLIAVFTFVTCSSTCDIEKHMRNMKVY